MNKNTLLFFDVETGGIGEQYSLLTAHFVVTDSEYNILNELSLAMKPDDGIYHVCGEAMSVNKIDLAKHDTMASSYKTAGSLLYEFLHENSNGGKIKLIPCGQGIAGDIRQVVSKLMSRNTWENFCSYRVFDTSVFAQGLKLAGIFPEHVSGGLSSLADYFHIKYEGAELHTAKADTLITIQVMKSLLKLVNK